MISDGVLNPERSILKTTNFDDSRVQMLARKILNEKKESIEVFFMLKKRHEQGDTFSVICGYKYFRVGA